tara:strand:+ start:1245 stop:1442 length:198 start_codon:yes stop_codon:yes gene_type:complete
MKPIIFEGKKFDDFKLDLDKVLEKHYPNTDYEWEHYDEDYNEVLSTDVNAKWRLVKVHLDLEDNQ